MRQPPVVARPKYMQQCVVGGGACAENFIVCFAEKVCIERGRSAVRGRDARYLEASNGDLWGNAYAKTFLDR